MEASKDVADQAVYSIGAVARMLRIPTATLRTWQERYGVVVPERSSGGHRLYSRPQIEQLRFLLDQTAAGLSAADAHRRLKRLLAQGATLTSTKTGDPSRLLILLAEPERHTANFAEYFLRTEGYEVTLVTSAAAAIAEAGVTPDLAVIDLMISGGGGLRLCRQLRETSEIPILAISSLERRDDALDAGASAFLRKPFDSLRLVTTIQDLLGRSALLRRESADS